MESIVIFPFDRAVTFIFVGRQVIFSPGTEFD